jgi:hypothetical protein
MPLVFLTMINLLRLSTRYRRLYRAQKHSFDKFIIGSFVAWNS